RARPTGHPRPRRLWRPRRSSSPRCRRRLRRSRPRRWSSSPRPARMPARRRRCRLRARAPASKARKSRSVPWVAPGFGGIVLLVEDAVKRHMRERHRCPRSRLLLAALLALGCAAAPAASKRGVTEEEARQIAEKTAEASGYARGVYVIRSSEQVKEGSLA